MFNENQNGQTKTNMKTRKSRIKTAKDINKRMVIGRWKNAMTEKCILPDQGSAREGMLAVAGDNDARGD